MSNNGCKKIIGIILIIAGVFLGLAELSVRLEGKAAPSEWMIFLCIVPLILAGALMLMNRRISGVSGLSKVAQPGTQSSIAPPKDKKANATRVPPSQVSEPSPKVNELISQLKDPQVDIRIKAASALGDLRAPQAIEPLIAALDDYGETYKELGESMIVDQSVRECARDALVKIGKPAVGSLILTLGNGNQDVVKLSAQALAQVGDQQAVEPLIEIVKADSVQPKLAAIRALGELKASQAIDPLLAALDDNNSMVQDYAMQSLQQITGQKLGRKAADWQQWLTIQPGQNVDERNDIGQTPLMLASATGNLEEAKGLLEKNASVNLVDHEGHSALFFATFCGNGHPEIIKALLRAGADVNLADNTGRTPLMHACQQGKLEIVNLLIDANADVNVRDKANNTALAYAYNSKYYKNEIFLLLKGRGAV